MKHDFKITDKDVQLVVVDGTFPSQTASIFSLGNGYIGVRGLAETDGSGAAERARDVVYLNGIYELNPISYHEGAYGYPHESEVRIPVFDCTGILIKIDGETVPNQSWRISHDERRLDTVNGTLHRQVKYENSTGATLIFDFERFVSCDNAHLVAARCHVTSYGFEGEIVIQNHMQNPFATEISDQVEPESFSQGLYDPRVGPHLRDNPWIVGERRQESGFAIVGYQAKRSGVNVATAHGLTSTGTVSIGAISPDGECVHETKLILSSTASKAHFDAITIYCSNRSRNDNDLISKSAQSFFDASTKGFDKLKKQHVKAVKTAMAAYGLEIPGDERLMGALRFNLLQLYMSVGKDGETSIGAKGQTGEGYEGHTFWDAELFALPALLYAHPDIARSLLTYRFDMLDAARQNARLMNHKSGALYSWRTITGQECSSFFPAGAAQYHINADIAYAVQQYMYATDDIEYLRDQGLELLVETARLWPEVGFFNPRKDGAFCINRVTGPDEYSAIVDNNLYTNVMARNHLQYLVLQLDELSTKDAKAFSKLTARLNIESQEISTWRKIAECMYLPYDEALGLYLQDEHTLDKEVWDFAGTPSDKYPLMLHYHPLVIYRYQVAKQADAVLAMTLCGDSFSVEEKLVALKYYEGVTVHDSTLSAGSFAILSADCDYLESAMNWLTETSFIDLENRHKNSDHGLHMAAMANSWNVLVFGFAGMRTYNGKLSFAPKTNDDLGEYKFKIKFKGRTIQLSIDHEKTVFRLIDGKPIKISHHGLAFTLTKNVVMERNNLAAQSSKILAAQ